MEVIVIKLKSDNQVVAVVEKASGLNAEQTAVLWAKAEGHSGFPKDLKFETGVPVRTAASILMANMPCSELDGLKLSE